MGRHYCRRVVTGGRSVQKPTSAPAPDTNGRTDYVTPLLLLFHTSQLIALLAGRSDLFRLCLCMFSFYIVHYMYYLIWAPA